MRVRLHACLHACLELIRRVCAAPQQKPVALCVDAMEGTSTLQASEPAAVAGSSVLTTETLGCCNFIIPTS